MTPIPLPYFYDGSANSYAELAAAIDQLRSLNKDSADTMTLRIDGITDDLILPMKAIQIWADGLQEISQFKSISIHPFKEYLSASEAAQQLGISRHYFLRNIIKTKTIPFQRVGNRYKIHGMDVIAYARAQQANSVFRVPH